MHKKPFSVPLKGFLSRRYPQGDSNARARLRRPVLYPLSYGGNMALLLNDSKLRQVSNEGEAEPRMRVGTCPPHPGPFPKEREHNLPILGEA
jgi:hypothetical protein